MEMNADGGPLTGDRGPGTDDEESRVHQRWFNSPPVPNHRGPLGACPDRSGTVRGFFGDTSGSDHLFGTKPRLILRWL